MRINTNILALSSLRSLSQTTRALARAMERLASGQRVNSARDDAAGMAIGSGLEAQRRGMLQAVRNMNDARGFLNTAEGAMTTQTELIQRMRELALQAANGTLSDTERDYINEEFQQLLSESERISQHSEFNGVKLLDGSFGVKSLQVGVQKSQTIEFQLADLRNSKLFLETSDIVGAGTFNSKVTLTAASQPADVRTADFNSDGYLDIVAVNSNNNSVTVILGNGNGTFQASTTYLTGSGTLPMSLDIADFNGDNRLDLVTANPGDNNASVLLGNGNGTFQNRTTVAMGASPHQTLAADVNADGKIDLINTDYNDTTLSILLGNGNGTFQSRTTIATNSNPWSVISGDYNEDGNIDLVSSDWAGAGGVSVFFGNGNGTFQTRMTLLNAGVTPADLLSADINDDGNLDFISTDRGSDWVSITLGNGNGTFQNRVTLRTGATPFHSSVLDMNSDGILDLATVDFGDNTVSTFIGNGNGTFQTRKTLAAATQPRSITAGDLNGDGVDDIVTADFGTASVSYYGAVTTGGQIVPAQMELTTQESAQDALDILDSALTTVNNARSSVGAIQSRLDYAENNASNLLENLSAARSQIMDADIAVETAEFIRLQVLQQAGISVLAQANLSSQLALKLLGSLG